MSGLRGIGTVAGGALGFMYGGPAGAAAGAGIGGALGGMLDPETGQPITSGAAAPMDPTAAAIYKQQLGDYRNMLQQYQGGPQSPYVQSMVNPAIETNAATLGAATQQQGLRGIRGSSFGEASLGNLAAGANRNIADISGQAQANQLAQQMNIQGGIGGIAGAYGGQAQNAMQQLIAQQNAANALGFQRSQANQKTFGNAMLGVSSLYGGRGSTGLGGYVSPDTQQGQMLAAQTAGLQ